MRHLLAALVLLSACAEAPQDEYEFKVVSYDDDLVVDLLNIDGRKGWHPVSCRRATSGAGGTPLYECILERRRRSDDAPASDTPEITTKWLSSEEIAKPDPPASASTETDIRLIRAGAKTAGCEVECIKQGGCTHTADGRCIAATNAHCEQSDTCRADQNCVAFNGACITK